MVQATYERRKPSPEMLNKSEALRELRTQSTISVDQLSRCANAVLPPHAGEGHPRFYTRADLALILVAHRLLLTGMMKYGHLALLVDYAHSVGLDPASLLLDLLHRGEARERAGGGARPHLHEADERLSA